MLKPHMPRFRSDPSVRLRDIAEKTGPREAETDSSRLEHFIKQCTLLFCQIFLVSYDARSIYYQNKFIIELNLFYFRYLTTG